MKKIFLQLTLVLLVVLTTAHVSFGQLTLASVEGLSYSRDVTYKNPITNTTETRKAGLCYGKIGNPYTGADACFYYYDITKLTSMCFPNFDYVDDSTSAALPKVIYIVYNYYPGKNPGVGQLSNLNNETAAIQMAIWHFTNGLDPATITSTTVRNRTNAIIAAANTNGSTSQVPTVLDILPDMDPDFFYVETKKDDGTPLAVNNISITISQGSVSPDNVNTTLPTGTSAPVQVIGTANGTITAIANDITLPKGKLFRHINNECPKVILSCPGPGTLKAEIEWGALPVELTAFTSSVNERNVTLNWSTSSELNNHGFDIERSDILTGWQKVGFVSGNGTTSGVSSYSFNDRGLTAGRFSYRLKQIDFNGNFEYFNLSNEVVIGVPEKFSVSQNYPNPFNPSTKISYDLPEAGNVSVKIFDMSGKEVASLVGEIQNAGYYTVSFDASALTSGVYFYRVNLESASQNFVMTKKMLLVK